MPAAIPLSVRTARAAITSGGSETVSRCLTIFLSVATARALLPEEVGVLGIAVIAVGLVSMIAYYAETAAVVCPGAEDVEYSIVAFCARALLTLVATWVLIAALPSIASRLVGSGPAAAELRALTRFLAWLPLLELVGAYPRVLLQRRLDLAILAVANLVQVVVHVGLAVVLLQSGFGAAGVVWGALAGVLAASIVAWLRLWAVGAPGWLSPSHRLIRIFAADYARVFANGFSNHVNGQIDKVLVAGSLGPAAMSYYGMAWNAARFPGGVLAQTLRFSMMPAVARLSGDLRAVERALGEALRHAVFLAAPLAAALLVSAPSLVLVVLGERWMPVVPALRVMSVAVVGTPFLEGAVTLLIGMGRAHLTAIGSVLSVVVLALLTPLLSLRWGVPGAAWANLASMVVVMVSMVLTARWQFAAVRWIRSSVVFTPLAAAIIAGAASFIVAAKLDSGIWRLLVESTVLAAVYLLVNAFFGGRETIHELVTILRRSLYGGSNAGTPALER